MRTFLEWVAIAVAFVAIMASLIYGDPEFLKCLSSFQPQGYCAVKTLMK